MTEVIYFKLLEICTSSVIDGKNKTFYIMITERAIKVKQHIFNYIY